jgi:hypothetical protein
LLRAEKDDKKREREEREHVTLYGKAYRLRSASQGQVALKGQISGHGRISHIDLSYTDVIGHLDFRKKTQTYDDIDSAGM